MSKRRRKVLFHVTITPTLCRDLVRHVPSPSVPPLFQPYTLLLRQPRPALLVHAAQLLLLDEETQKQAEHGDCSVEDEHRA